MRLRTQANPSPDPTLATACFAFLPELCAENAYSGQMLFPEQLFLQQGEQPRQAFYKTQLADYQAIRGALFAAMAEDAFAPRTDEIFKKYVSHSASATAIWQAKQRDGSLRGARLPALLFQVDSAFSLR